MSIISCVISYEDPFTEIADKPHLYIAKGTGASPCIIVNGSTSYAAYAPLMKAHI
jgi:hypothetical protein